MLGFPTTSLVLLRGKIMPKNKAVSGDSLCQAHSGQIKSIETAFEKLELKIDELIVVFEGARGVVVVVKYLSGIAVAIGAVWAVWGQK